MREGEPGWFYVGNGQLRYKDGAGWTDRYEDIDGDATTSDVELGPVSGKSGRRRGGPALSPFTRRCAAAAYRMIAPGWRLIAAGVRRGIRQCVEEGHRTTSKTSRGAGDRCGVGT